MTQRNVEQFLGRLATDPDLRARFHADQAATLAAYGGEGHELSTVEMDALARVEPEALERFAESLDPRIQRAAGVAR
jgi:hypothetical protein